MKLKKEKQVAILMATFNGAKYLEQQLQSIEDQTYDKWKLWVSDDGSTDRTLEILNNYVKKWGKEKIEIFDGPKQGFASNFLYLICKTGISGDYFAFSDQDDIWLPKKIENSINYLSSFTNHEIALYCSRTILIDSKNEIIGKSKLFKLKPSFENAMFQSIAGANTMVMNKKLHELFLKFGTQKSIISHDWHAYILATASGGNIFYNPEPDVLYRQHENNKIGQNLSLNARLQRAMLVFKGKFKEWFELNLRSLHHIEHLLDKKNIITLNNFNILRNKNFFGRLYSANRIPFYRHSKIENMAIKILFVLKLL